MKISGTDNSQSVGGLFACPDCQTSVLKFRRNVSVVRALFSNVRPNHYRAGRQRLVNDGLLGNHARLDHPNGRMRGACSHSLYYWWHWRCFVIATGHSSAYNNAAIALPLRSALH
jgi:hypothetical protein